MPIELHTPDSLQYQFYPASGGCFGFKVRAPNDAHIALAPGPAESEPITEIFLGGWGNTKSVIRKNRQKPDVVEVDTPGILNAGEYRGFWIRWYQGVVTVGHEGDVAAFMSFEDPYLHQVNYIGVCTGWGATGTWQIDDSPCPPASAPGFSPHAPPAGWNNPTSGRGAGVWVPARGGQVPPEAVEGGFDGEQLYIARAHHEGALIPGKLLPSHNVVYIPWGGAEHAKDEYEVLCSASGNWFPVSGANMPPNALPAGQSESGESLFIGRANHNGTITIGKVQPSHGCCYIPYGGQEISYADYEVFIPN